MNEKISADLKSLQLIFSKNRAYILPGAIILVSIILFFQFVVPQFSSYLQAREEAKELSLKLEVLKENLNVLSNISEQTLDSQLQILTLALPLNKDFFGILNSVYSAAQKTGVSLGSFSFVVGDLSKIESSSFPVIKLSIPVSSGVFGTNNFIETINRTFPLAEVDMIKVGEASSMVGLSFYYKPLSVSNYSADARISPISQKGLTLINQLSEFPNTPSLQESLIPVATYSGRQ